MKRFLLLSTIIILGLTLSAQTQQGYVKTKGRMVNGKLVPGQGLKGATVSIKGRTSVLVKADDGAFSFPVPEAQFRVDSVRKKGYQLVDMDALSKTYKHSVNPIYLVMETPEQQLQDQLAAERKIRRTLTNQLHQREDEIEALKERQTISDEEYRQALQKLYEETDQNEQLVKDMAKRYSELDYDQLDEFYRQVSYCIENGDLTKADSLLKSRGDITKQVREQLKKGQAIQEQSEQLCQAKAVHATDNDELEKRCFGYYETFLARHLNDSAAYYLELRASLDSTNIKWQLDAGRFIDEYLADYDKALCYYSLALRQALQQQGEQSVWPGACHNNIGWVYSKQGDYGKALEHLEKALTISKAVLGENHPDVATCYNNIGLVYNDQDNYGKALEYLGKGLTISKAVLGENHPNIAHSYNNIGLIYDNQGNYDKALEYFEKAITINKTILGENHPDLAMSYDNIGYVYSKQGDYDKALEYSGKALTIYKDVLGENHPNIAHSYNNIGFVYANQGDYCKALEYYEKALTIQKAALGETHPDVALSYSHTGNVYFRQGNYDKALEYLGKGLTISKAVLGESHPNVAIDYYNIGFVYNKQGDYDKALEYFEKALNIFKAVLGEEHPSTIQTKEKISEIQAKLKEQEDKQKTEE